MKKISILTSLIMLLFLTLSFNYKEKETEIIFYNNNYSSSYSKDTLILHVDKNFTPQELDEEYELEEISNDYYLLKFNNSEYTSEEIYNRIKNTDGIKYVELDYLMEKTSVYLEEPLYNDMWHIKNTTYGINPFNAWNLGFGSEEVVVAVLDTGIDLDHPDLINNIWKSSTETINGIDTDGNGLIDDVNGWDFFKDIADVNDTSGHGTLVSGAIASEMNKLGTFGVAPNVKIMPLKVSNDAYEISLSAVIKAITYGKNQGVRIFNLSFGSNDYIKTFEDIIKNTDALFVAAAGNGDSSYNGLNNDIAPLYPANYNAPNLIAVAAINSAGKLTTFSNYGPTTVDLAAPGSFIMTTNIGGVYEFASGTSLATPLVAGAAALLMSQDLDIEIVYLRELILNSVKKVNELAGKVATEGTLNVSKMFELYDAATPETLKTGDLNGDKSITMTDLIILRKHLAGLETIVEAYLPNGDVDKDGIIGITDLIKVRKHLAGLEVIE